MVRKATFIKIFRWHFPYIAIAAFFTLLAATLYFKWYDITPIKAANGDVFLRLMEGNKRFASGHPRHPGESVKHRKNVAKGQHPFALVITCSDSRVSPELVFDQGLGDLFVIRTAGNLVSEMELGSIVYAIEHLHVKNIVVMGHEDCGAVKALMSNEQFEGHVKTIVDSLQRELEMKQALENHDLKEAILANIRHQVNTIANDHDVKGIAKHHSLSLRGVYYELSDGKVTPTDSIIVH